jgi:hypothetical protein
VVYDGVDAYLALSAVIDCGATYIGSSLAAITILNIPSGKGSAGFRFLSVCLTAAKPVSSATKKAATKLPQQGLALEFYAD